MAGGRTAMPGNNTAANAVVVNFVISVRSIVLAMPRNTARSSASLFEMTAVDDRPLKHGAQSLDVTESGVAP
jgi:hypothetical protein